MTRTSAPAAAAAAPASPAPAAPEPAVIDPCDPKRMMFDSIDLLAYEIITNPSKRAERKGQLEYFLERVGDLPHYGRAGSRLGLACLLENFCCRDAYQLKDPASTGTTSGDKEQPKEAEASKAVPLVVMSPEEWQTYAQMLENMYGDLRRMDANAPILPEALAEQKPSAAADQDTNDDDVQTNKNKDPRIVAYNKSLLNATLNPALEDHREFTRKYREIEISLQFHRAMAGTLREVLEQVLATPGGDMAESEDSDSDEEEEEEEEVPEVSQEVLVEFHNFINEKFTEEWGIGAKDLLLKLIHVEAGDDGYGGAVRIRLRKPSKLRKVYSRKEFDLIRFQRKMERLMTKWNEVVLDVPRMVAMSYSQTVFPPSASDAERPVAPERPMPVMEKRVRQKKKASEAAAADGDNDDDVAAPMPDDDEYEADKEQSTSKKSKKDKRKRRDRDDGDDGDEAAEFGPTGTQVKKKRRRGKRDRISLDQMDRKGGSKENQPEVEDGPEVKELARARDNLREEVVDPLDDMRALAATAQAGPVGARAAAKKKAQAVAQKRLAEQDGQTPNIYKKKKSSKQLQWTSDEESDSDDGDDDAEIKAGTTLSEVPNRPKIKKATPPSQQKKAKPATQLLVHRERNSGGVLKRKKFTEEEKGAIKLGVQRFGFGKWAQIKEYYAEELMDRTSVNIKDCYRTMQRKGEV